MVAKMGKATKDALAPTVEGLRQDAAADGGLPALREQIEAIVEATINAGVVESMLSSVDRHSLSDVSRVLGIGPELLSPGLALRMTEVRRANVALIRSIGEEYLAQVEELVTVATTQGIRAEALQRALVERLGVAQSRAELIAVDQVLRSNSQLAQERYQRVGITSYRWSTSRDERVREGHAALEGDVFRFDSPPVVDPSGRRANPGQDYRCRCVAIAQLDD
jgi:SPP1 gp7 family putative phage head morphogenesis protein